MLNQFRWPIWGTVISAMLISGIATAGPFALPPRPTPPPAALPGALIELRVPTTDLNHFTVVQWKSNTGSWHIVESWQGNLDDVITIGGNTMAFKRWWVYPADYGQHNFRWQVYDRPNGKLLATSAVFNLPTSNRQDVISYVTLPQHSAR